MKLLIEMNLDNAAFATNGHAETASLLRQIARDLEGEGHNLKIEGYRFADSNDKSAGSVRVVS